MARAKAKRGKSKAGAADDAASVEGANKDAGSPQATAWEQAWDAALENSAAPRAKGIRALCEMLQHGYDCELALQKSHRLTELAVSQLNAKKGDRASEAASADLLAVLFLTLGRDCQDAFGGLQDTLQERCREGRARPACIAAYVAGALAASDTDADRLAALRFAAGLWLTQRGAALEAALRGWAALLAMADVRTLSTPLIEATLAALATHLAGSDVAVRSAAAECLGLLYQRCGLEALPDDDDELLPDGERGAGSEGGVSASCVSIDGSARQVGEEAAAALADGFEAVLQRVEDLATNRGDAAKLSKGDRRASKRTAADVLATMNGAAGRAQTVVLPGRGRIVLDTLALRVTYRFLCSVVGSATPAHLRHNPLFAELLGLSSDGDEPEGEGEVKAWRGGDARADAAARGRAKHRESTARMAAHMMPQLDEG